MGHPHAWRRFLRDRYSPWDVLDDPAPSDPVPQVERDVQLAASIARAPGDLATAPLYRVWTNQRCLVVTKREQRLDGYAAAATASTARGWPVVLRDSGGTVVPHLPTTVLLTLILPRRAAPEPRAEAVFECLGAPVIEALDTLGIAADYGAVPHSFCDGRFNLVANGRKIAGTAQRWRGGLPGHAVRAGFVLAHLALYVAADMAAATDAVNTFLQAAGRPAAYDPAALTTVRTVAPPDLAALPAMTLHTRVRRALLNVLRS